jgi:MYXO-CTERM domain-containing protein
VSGSNFVSGVQVTFGGATATVSGSTTGSISCVTPPGTPGAVDLVVTNPDGRTANLTGGFTYLAAGDAGTTNHPGGCGCQTPGSAWVWGAAVATIALRRRRSLDG